MRLCISTVVDSKYQYFMPLFIFCLRRVYPDYDIKIFTHGKLARNVKSALAYLTGFKLVPKLFDDWNYTKYAPISWRFLIPPEHYHGYDFVYVGDVDMMILPEKVSLLNFHYNEMAETGFCYSNSLRSKRHWKGKESFTGLHFASQEWFTRTEARRKIHAEKVRTGKEGEKREWDGHMLYLMTKSSNLHIVPKAKNIKKRHHGIHLGNFRLYSDFDQIKKRVDADMCRKWMVIRRDQTFIDILTLVSVDNMVRESMEKLDAHCRRMIG